MQFRSVCYWAGRCLEECPADCPDYTPLDSFEQDAAFYAAVIEEDAAEYIDGMCANG